MFSRRVEWTLNTRLQGRRYASTVKLAFNRYEPSKRVSQTTSALIILHGLFGFKRNWASVGKRLADRLGVPVIPLDLRNHGSSPHDELMNYPVMAEDVVEFCREHKLSNVALLGHSMGGKVAMSVALNHQYSAGLLSHLIIEDITPAKGGLSQEFQDYLAAMKEIGSNGLKSKEEALTLLEKKYNTPRDVGHFLLTNLLPLARDTSKSLKFQIPLDILSDTVGALGDFPYNEKATPYMGKTLMVKGDQSNYVNDRTLALACRLFPKLQLEEIEASHWGELAVFRSEQESHAAAAIVPKYTHRNP